MCSSKQNHQGNLKIVLFCHFKHLECITKSPSFIPTLPPFRELSNINFLGLFTLTVASSLLQNLVWSNQFQTSSMYHTSWYSTNYCHRTCRKYRSIWVPTISQGDSFCIGYILASGARVNLLTYVLWNGLAIAKNLINGYLTTCFEISKTKLIQMIPYHISNGILNEVPNCWRAVRSTTWTWNTYAKKP